MTVATKRHAHSCPKKQERRRHSLSFAFVERDSKWTMPYAQLVIGPPGSGKTTYCKGMQEMLTSLGRKVAVVNLDPANEFLPYECAVNMSDLVTLTDVVAQQGLGPNGGIMYCAELLETNFDWLLEKLAQYEDHYFLFDCPGQVELFTHHQSIRNIVDRLQKENFRLVAVNLVDAHYCTEPSKFISVLLISLVMMLQLELPHINVLSKVDLMEAYGKLHFNLDFYTEVLDLSYLLNHLEQERFSQKFRKLNRALCDLIQDFSLVCFHTLCIEDKDSVVRLVRAVDKAGGYVFGVLNAGGNAIILEQVAREISRVREVMDVQERYVDYPELYHQQETI